MLVAFIVIGFMALALAEVASRFEVTGGPQVYAQIAFGPLAGFTVGWLFTLSRFASFALIAQVMFDYAAVIWPALGDAWMRAAGITLYALVFAVVNVRGVKLAAWSGNIITIAKLLPLVPIALAGLWFAGWNNLPVAEPRAPDGLANALQLALFACFGFDVASILAGEMRIPGVICRSASSPASGSAACCTSCSSSPALACCLIRLPRNCPSPTSRRPSWVRRAPP